MAQSMANSIELGSGHLVIDADTSEFKKKLAGLKVDAVALTNVMKGLDKVTSNLSKFVVAPAMAIATMGVKTYMKTTESGAFALSVQLRQLQYSWLQMLARVGEAIVKHTELTKIIEKLKKFIDSISEKQIMKFLDIAKWTAISVIVVKMAKSFFDMFTWANGVLKSMTALGLIGGAAAMEKRAVSGSQASKVLGESAGGLAGGLVGAGGSGLAAGIGAGIGTRNIAKEIETKLLKDFKGLDPAFAKMVGEINSTKLGAKTVNTAAASAAADAVTATATVAGASAALKSFFVKLAGFIKLGGIIAGAVALLAGFISGVSSTVTGKESKLLTLMDVIGKIFSAIGIVINSIFKGIYALGLVLGQPKKWFSKTKDDPLKSIREDFINTIGKDIADLFGADIGEKRKGSKLLEFESQKYGVRSPDEKDAGVGKRFQFGHEFMGSTGLADLNKVFQQLALEDMVIDISKQQLEVSKQIRDRLPENKGEPKIPGALGNVGV